MINVEYKLEQVGSAKEFQLNESVASYLKNSTKRFKLKGPNGKGKTFLMNLIASALLQDQRHDDWFIPSITSKIASVSNTKLYNLEYDIELRINEDVSIVCKKDLTGDRLVQYKKKGELRAPMSFTALDKDVDVIYDIPVDIGKRLENVISDSVANLERLKSDYTLAAKTIANVKLMASDSKDEQVIERLNRQIVSIDDLELKPALREKQELTKIRKELLIIAEYKDYLNVYQSIQRFEKELNALNKQLKGKVRPKGSGDNTIALRKLNQRLSTEEKDFLTARDKFFSDLHDNEKVKSLFISKCAEPMEIYEDYLKPLSGYDELEVESAINQLSNGLDEILVDLINDDAIKFARSLDVIKRALEGLSKVEGREVDLIFGKSIEDILEALENEAKGLDTTDYNQVIKAFQSSLKDAKSKLKLIYKTHIEISRESKKAVLTEDDKKILQKFEKRKQIKTDLPDLKKRLEVISSRIVSSTGENSFLDNIDTALNHFNKSKDKASLQDYVVHPGFGIELVKKRIQIKGKEIENLEIKTAELKILLDREQRKPDAPFGKAQIKRLEGYTRAFSILITELDNWIRTLKSYNRGEYIFRESSSDGRLFNALGMIIAESFKGKIYLDEGTEVNVTNYNLLDKHFETDKPEVFYSLEYLSTGLASSNYLRQKINRTEKPYVVVLLDEIGDMDDQSLKYVQDEIIRLDEQKRLLLCIMATPSNDKELVMDKF